MRLNTGWAPFPRRAHTLSIHRRNKIYVGSHSPINTRICQLPQINTAAVIDADPAAVGEMSYVASDELLRQERKCCVLSVRKRCPAP
jgi:hypothetical protein